MKRVLVDSNVLIDVLNKYTPWYQWSVEQLESAMSEEVAVINPLILAEVSAGYDTMEIIDQAFSADVIDRIQLPWEAAFPASQAFRQYRRRGGTKTSPLPDFYIGAHALVSNFKILTRDVTRYQTCFPQVDLIAPPQTA